MHRVEIGYKGYTWIIYISEYDYDGGERGTPPSLVDPGSPDYPETVAILDGYVQLLGSGAMVAKINKQLCEAGYGPLMKMFIHLHEDTVKDIILDTVYGLPERDYEMEAEMAEFDRNPNVYLDMMRY